MGKIEVVIFSAHSLFREGLRRILANVPSVELVGHTQTIEDVEPIIEEHTPDFIIVEHLDEDPMHQENITRLLSLAGVRVLTVSLDEGQIQVYRRDSIGEATAEKLIAALTGEQI